MKETIRVNPESLKKADLPGIDLSSRDLMVLLAASFGNNKQWTPNQEIQISGYRERLLPYGWTEMVSEKYRKRTEGKGGGNIILSPEQVDEKFDQLVRKVLLNGLIPLIDLYYNNHPTIDSLKLLPNTSLGVEPLRRHFNGLIINVNKDARKENIDKLMNDLKFPWGRSVLVCKLSGIDVKAFVSNFADGSNLTPSLQPCKFSDFLYDKKGEVYVVIGGGGLKKRTVFDIYGTNKKINCRLNTLYNSAKNELIEKAKILIEKIGRGVGFKAVTAYPYVGYDPESQTLFSGLPVSNYVLFNPLSNYVLFNPRPRPDLNLNYILHNGSLIGANPKSPVAKIVGPLKISGTSLTRVANFGV